MNLVTNLKLHNNRGEFLPDEDFFNHLKEWDKTHPDTPMFGPIVKYTWEVNSKTIEHLNPKNEGLKLVPDRTGFLCCENSNRIDNLLLLDAYGQERMRLSPPWEMTDVKFIEGGKDQVNFLGYASPWSNPMTGELGVFGVRTTSLNQWGTAYYFELDWRTGKFLWCYCLARG